MKKLIKRITYVTGILTWIVVMFKSGLKYSFGYGFWGPNGHDGMWHIALANNLSNFDFSNPAFSGESVKNYHVGYDLILGVISKITLIPVNIWYFQIMPVIMAVLIGYLVYKLTKSYLSLFFAFFGGSAAWIFAKGESAFWAQQAISTLVNPPFALSLIFILLGLISLQNKKTFWAIICFGILIQVKAYAGILVLGALLVASVYSYYIQHTTYHIKIFLGSLLVNVVLAFVIPNDGLSSFSWQPFWFLETMMSYSDRFGWQRFYSAMTTYKMGGLYFKYLISYLVAFFIFVVGNFWTRLIFVKDIFKKIDVNKVFLLTIIVAGVLIPTFFVQQGTPWNTIQFMYYSLFFSGLLAGISAKNLSFGFLAFIFFVTVPTTVLTLKDVYIPSRPPAKLSNYEIDALDFLSKQPDGVVLTYPYDKDKAKEAENNPPRPLYLYESTAYISAFSKKKAYLEDEVNLNIMGYDYIARKEGLINWYKEADISKAIDFLNKNDIKYVYWIKPQRAVLGDKQLGLKMIFENEEVTIYKYDKDLGSN